MSSLRAELKQGLSSVLGNMSIVWMILPLQAPDGAPTLSASVEYTERKYSSKNALQIVEGESPGLPERVWMVVCRALVSPLETALASDQTPAPGPHTLLSTTPTGFTPPLPGLSLGVCLSKQQHHREKSELCSEITHL